MGISIGKIGTNILTSIDFILDTGETEAIWNYNSQENKISSVGRDRFEITIENAENILMVIEKWISWIRSLLHPAETGEVEIPNDSQVKTLSTGDMTFNIKIGDLDIKEKWNKGDNYIVLFPRNGFEITWDGILYFVREQKQFLNMIKEYKE